RGLQESTQGNRRLLKSENTASNSRRSGRMPAVFFENFFIFFCILKKSCIFAAELMLNQKAWNEATVSVLTP
ncbi:MAG: hypothetical protein J6X59_05000, partial [Bacteroidales bacterium]|nr:hypothetical protein [Bacteroidales bacterium]